MAAAVGGRLVARATGDDRERMLLNVVEEVAIASGVPVPPVYLLDAEPGINAFAAGFAPHQAVVAVTRGALSRLSRDDLQGVVAHEFSHILNGDMRLNIRMAGVVAGIIAVHVLGRWVVRIAARIEDKAALPLLGLGIALLAIGGLGWLLGEMIKAAVSRHREFLADAAAAQFTRHPAGLAGALRKIRDHGSRLDHPRAEEFSHMFLGDGVASWFSSHPPIEERLARLEGATMVAEAPGVTATRAMIDGLPSALIEAIRTPQGARHVVLALLVAEDESAGALLEGSGDAAPVRGLQPIAAAAPAEQWVALVDLALAALAELDSGQRREFLAMVDRLVLRDGRVSVFERAAAGLLHGALAPALPRRAPFVAAAATVLAAVERGSADAGFDRALARVADASAARKHALLEAATRVAERNGTVAPEEARMLAMLAQSLGLPATRSGVA